MLFAPIAGKIADRKGPHAVIGLGSVIMLTSWVVFGAWGMIAGVILLDFGEQGALISNQNVEDGMGERESPNTAECHCF